MMVWLAQRTSVAEHLVSRIDGGAGPFGQSKAISRVAGKSRLAVVASDTERTGYFHVVPIQHYAEHAGLEVGEELVDQLQDWDTRIGADSQSPGQTVGLVQRDQEGQLQPSGHILQHNGCLAMSGAVGETADQHWGHCGSPSHHNFA